jgi:mono/diheme cytochrome c family protein
VWKTLLFVSMLFLLRFSVSAQQAQTSPKAAPVVPYTIPADAVRQANPVKPTPESIAQGKKWYGYDCAMCHGNNGDGKGDVGKLAIPDLTTTVLTLTITGIGDSSLAKGNNPRLAKRLESIAAMFLGAALGAVVIHYSISAALWLATAISAVCSAALFRSVRTSDKL